MCAKRFPTAGRTRPQRRAGRSGGPVRRRPGQHRADPPRPSARRRTQRRAGRAGATLRRRRRRHHRRALRRTVAGPAGHGDGRHPGPATRWTRRPAGWPRWAVRTCGRARRWPGCSRSGPEVVTAAAELGEQCAFGLALIAPQLPPFDVPGRAHRGQLAAAAGDGGRPQPLRAAGAARRGPTRRSSTS